MLVDIQVSSINTSFSRSIPGCASLHARRAACTSARSCSSACKVFFKGELPFVQLVPQRRDLGRHALFRQPLLQLGQGQIGLGCDPVAQHLFPLRQPGPAMAADRKTAAHARLLLPVPHLIDPDAAHLEPPSNFRRALDRGDRPTEIARRFEVSRVWVYQVRDRQQETGVRSSFPIGGHRRSRLAEREQVLRDWITAEPDLTLAELQQRLAKQGVATKIATLWHQLNKWKLTFKKNLARRRARARRRAGGAARME